MKKKKNSDEGNIFRKFVLITAENFEELNEKKSLKALFPNILPIENEMIKVLENSSLSTAQRLSFYKNLLYSQFASNAASAEMNKRSEENAFGKPFAPAAYASKTDKSLQFSFKGNDMLENSQNMQRNDFEDDLNSMNINETLKPSSETTIPRLYKKKKTESSLLKRLFTAKDDDNVIKMRKKIIFDDYDEDDESDEELFHEAHNDERKTDDEENNDDNDMFESIVDSSTPLKMIIRSPKNSKKLSKAKTQRATSGGVNRSNFAAAASRNKTPRASSEEIYNSDSEEFDRSLERQKIYDEIAESSSNKKNIDFRKLQYRYLDDPRKEYFNVQDPLNNDMITLDKSSPLKRYQKKVSGLHSKHSTVAPRETRSRTNHWITFEEAFR